MLIKSILQKVFSVKRFYIEKVEGKKEGLYGYIKARGRSKPLCPVCKRKAWSNGHVKERTWRFVPVWGIQVYLRYTPRRVICRKCGRGIEDMAWSMGKSPVSLHLAVVIALLTRKQAWKDVAEMLGIHWNTVRAAIARIVAYGLKHRDTSQVKNIGIDEISRKKGHVYQTNIYDLDQGRLLWTGPDRGAETLDRFFKEWGSKRINKLVAICCDMWDPYIKSITEHAPDAILVFDKYHIITHLNKAVDTVRKEEYREKKETNPDLLKGTKYIWLKNPENLTDNQRTRLGELEQMNLKINRAYLLKESFKKVYEYTYAAWAEKYLKWWCARAMRSRLKPIKEFVRMIRRYWKNVITYFKEGITNARVEGLNRKAKVVTARSYGFKSDNVFSLAMYHSLGELPIPETIHKFL